MPNLTAAEGPLTRAETLLAATLAACPRWQTLCGSAEAAAARIYFDALPPPAAHAAEYSPEDLALLRPFALVYTDEETGVTLAHAATGARRRFAERGVLKFYIEKHVPPDVADHPAEVDRRFKNDVGILLGELAALAGQANYLAIDEITAQGPLRSHQDELPTKGDYQQMHFTVSWGAR
jgi:hypothetical protein